MRRLIPDLVKALDQEILVAGRGRGVDSISLKEPQPRDQSSTMRPGVSAIWFRTLSPDFILYADDSIGTLRVGGASFDASVVASEAGRLLLSVEHPRGALPAMDVAELILDPTKLLKVLSQRLREADSGQWGLNWALLAKVMGRPEAEIGSVEPGACRLEGLSDEQAAAVTRAIGSEVLFLQGPPGTGKTKTISHVVASALALGKSILVTSHTHVAVDQALLACVGRNGPVALTDKHRRAIVRVGDPRLQGIPDDLVLQASDLATPEGSQRLKAARAVFATLTKVYMDTKLLSRPFDIVLIDEVSMVNCALALMAMGRAQKSIVLVGDPHQLPPIVLSPMAQEVLGKDLFEISRATSRPCFAKITVQRRMRPEIADIARQLRYSRQNLDDHESVRSRSHTLQESPLGTKPLVFVPLEMKSGLTWRDRSSYWNLASAVATVETARALAERIPRPAIDQRRPIGIIVPYASQRRLLLRVADAAGILDWVLAGTVHTFQGNEADIVLVDPVVGPPVSNARLLTGRPDGPLGREANVAVTRARDQLVVVADPLWWRDYRESAFGIVVDRVRGGDSRRWKPWSAASKTWMAHKTVEAAAATLLRSPAIAFVSGSAAYLNAWRGAVSDWAQNNVEVMVGSNASEGRPNWLPETVRWQPWARAPELALTDERVVVAPDGTHHIDIRSRELAEEISRLMRIQSIDAFFQRESHTCKKCGQTVSIEVVMLQGDESILASCPSRGCVPPTPMVRQAARRFVPRTSSPRVSAPPRTSRGNTPRNSGGAPVATRGKPTGSLLKPKSDNSNGQASNEIPRHEHLDGLPLWRLIPASPAMIRVAESDVYRIKDLYVVSRPGSQPLRIRAGVIEQAWSQWLVAGRPSNPRVLGRLNRTQMQTVVRVFSAIAAMATRPL